MTGRLRNVRQGGESRQRESSAEAIPWRYSSRPLRRSSTREGLFSVDERKCFFGRVVGGGSPMT